MVNKSTFELTEEQQYFWKKLRIRATTENIGQPYLSVAIFNLIPVNSPGIKTMGVDKFWRIYIDFDFFLGDDFPHGDPVIEGTKFLNHEPWHLLREHHTRAENITADPELWNIAGDLTINQGIENLVPTYGVHVGKGHFTKFRKNLTTEEYYDELKNQTNKQPPKTQPKPQCGSGAHNKKQQWELPENEGTSLNKQETESIARNVAHAIEEYHHKNPGKTNSELDAWAKQTLTAPLPDWKTILRAEIRKALKWGTGQHDYTYKKPSRRNPNPTIILPTLQAPKPRITIAIDTSGSNLHNLKIAVDNIENISKKSGARGKDLTAFSVQTTSSTPKMVPTPSEVIKNLTGGGGTDMREAFKTFNTLTQQNKTDICVLITDLETPWPTRPTNRPTTKTIVVGVLNSHHTQTTITAAKNALKGWADLIIVDPHK